MPVSATEPSRRFGNPLSRGNRHRTKYYYDGQNVIEETDGSGNLQRYFVNGTQYIDERVLMHNDTEPEGEYYYLERELHTVSGLVTASGNWAEGYAYGAYGDVKVTDGSGNPLPKSAVGNPYYFTGRELDFTKPAVASASNPPVQTYHYRARSYDAQNGRFRQRDPLYGGPRQPAASASAVALYEYVGSRPTVGVDPFGLFECEQVRLNAPTDKGKSDAFAWLTPSWTLLGAIVTDALAGSKTVPIGGVRVEAKIASGIMASWVRQYAEVFKCCLVRGKPVVLRTGNCPRYLWGEATYALTARSRSKVDAAPLDFITVAGLAVMFPLPFDSLGVDYTVYIPAAGFYLPVGFGERNALLKVARETDPGLAPPTSTAPILLGAPRPPGTARAEAFRGLPPPGADFPMLVPRIGCDPGGTKAPWPGTAVDNSKPAPRKLPAYVPVIPWIDPRTGMPGCICLAVTAFTWRAD